MKPKSNPFLRRFQPVCIAISVAGLSLLGLQGVHAADTWTGTTNQDWNTATNWGGAFPTAGIIINTATGNYPIYDEVTPAFATPNSITIGNAAAGRLDVIAGTLATGNGNFNVIVGAGALGNGTLNLTGTGSINAGGTSTTLGALILGNGGTSTGTATLNSTGTLKAESDTIAMFLGNGGTSVGNFTLTTGTLQLNSLNTTGIAILNATNGGDGTFTMTGGTVNATGGVWAGDNAAGSQGVYNISGGSFNVTSTGSFDTSQAGLVYIGRGLGQGTFNVSGTAAVTFTNANGSNVGYSNTATAGTTGLLTVSGGTFTNTGDLRVGVGQRSNGVTARADGTFNVSAGIANIGGSLVLARGNDSGDLVTGNSTVSGTGTVNVANDLVIAFAGNSNLGQMTISGGTVNVGTTTEKWVHVNQWDTSRGQLTVSGGTLNLNGNSDLRFSTSNSTGASIVTLSSGAITSYSGNGTGSTTTGELDMNKAGAAAANNTFHLNGGTLTIQQVISTVNTGTAVFNFNGGTLKAANSSANFVDLGGATQTAVVKSGGAIIDSNGFDVTAVQALIDGTGGGGLTKSGNGTLTLSGVNTFTGATNVNGGTVTLGSSGSINNSSGIIINGSGAKFLQTSSVASTSAITLTQGTLDGAGTVGSVNLGAAGLASTKVLANGNGSTATLTTGALNFGGAATINLASTTAGVGIAAGALTTSGTDAAIVFNIGRTGAWTNGVNNLLSYSSFTSADINDFALGTITGTVFGARQTSGGLVFNGNNIALQVNGTSIYWTGLQSNQWTTNAVGGAQNWKQTSDNVATDFIAADDIVLNDTPGTNQTLQIDGANVSPNSLTFDNTTAVSYTIASSGAFGIAGTASVVKNGNGLVTINTSNSYTGGTIVNAGTLAINSATSLGNASGALTLNNGTLQTTADITTARNITLGNANSTILTNSGTTYTVNGVVSGTGALNKTGLGTLTLGTATNTFGGGLVITNGTVSVDNNLRLGGAGGTAGAITLDGGTLRATAGITNTHAVTVGANGGTINVTAAQYFFNTANTLLGNGNLTVTGNGTLATSGAGNLRIAQTNTYSGAVTATSGGIFEYGIAGAVGAGATFNIGNQGELAVQNATSLPNAVTVTGGTNSVLSFENGNTGNFSGLVTLNANAIIGLRDWYNNATVRGGTISGQVTGIGGLTVNSGSGNGGLLTLSNATNDYSGGTTISASKVLATTSAAFGTNAVAIGGTNAQLQLGSGVDVANAFTINSGAGVTAQGIIWVPTLNANATVSGPITINAIPTSGGHFGANGGTLTVAGAITSSVAVSSRIGTVVFSNTGSSYSQLNVNEGTVRIGATNAIPVAASVDLGASGAAIFDMAGFNQTLAGITKNTNAATVTNSGTSNSTLTTTGTSNFAGVIQNGGTNTTAVTVSSGTLTLSGANTYTGASTINGGTLSVGADNSLGASAAAVTLNGGTLRTTAGFTNTHAITVGGSGGTINIATTGQLWMDTANTLLGSGTLNLTGSGTLAALGLGNFRVAQTNTFNGAVNVSSGGNFEYGVAGAVDAAATFNIGNEGELAVQGIVPTSMPNAITVSGGTNSVLSFENGDGGNYSGSITLDASATFGLRDWYNTAVARSGTVSGVISGAGGITTDRGTTGSATLTLTNSNTYFGATTINAGSTLQLGNGSIGNDGTIANTSGVTNNGTLAYNRFGSSTASYAIGGSGDVTKLGNGTQTLTGSNTYSGTTTVNGGTLLVNGNHTGNGTYTVGASGTLGGTGSLGDSTINVTGVLAPGASVGFLSSGTVNFTTGSTYAYEVDSTDVNADLQIISGDLNLTGTVTLTFADLAGFPVAFAEGTVFSLFNYSGEWNEGLLTYGVSALADDSTFSMGSNIWQIDYNAAEGGLNYTDEYLGGSDSFVNITAVPEPASAVLGGLGLLALLRRRRRE